MPSFLGSPDLGAWIRGILCTNYGV